MENAAFHATYIYSIDFSAVNHFRELYKRIYDGFHLSADKQAPTDIQNLKSLFESDGQTVTLIDAEDLADRSVFNYSQCDLLVLPYGERFPFDALVNYKEYVHDGGKVLTLGGHAFLNLLQDDPGHAAAG